MNCIDLVDASIYAKSAEDAFNLHFPGGNHTSSSFVYSDYLFI